MEFGANIFDYSLYMLINTAEKYLRLCPLELAVSCPKPHPCKSQFSIVSGSLAITIGPVSLLVPNGPQPGPHRSSILIVRRLLTALDSSELKLQRVLSCHVNAEY